MKTTIDIPDKTFRRAKTLAAANGMTLKQLVAQAIEDKLSHGAKTSKAEEPTWMKLYGAFAKTKAMRGIATFRIGGCSSTHPFRMAGTPANKCLVYRQPSMETTTTERPDLLMRVSGLVR